ncbi:MAG: AAA family ATPase [Oscillospiraceae bacterium]|jgi:SpoVK/Ycf46/Vps4 family AAA+-type ATPase|nr:AAA family ATPase [Oscillospiraceae bacterium]
MDKKPKSDGKDKTPDFSGLRAGGYIDSLSDFADLLGVIENAELAARDLQKEIEELDSISPRPTASSTGNKIEVPAVEEAPLPDLDTLLAELDTLVGLQQIKDSVRSLINLVKIRKLRQDEGLSVPPMSLHMVFTGNPGTGKTTVARILSGLYRAIGVLSKGHLVETDRQGLVAGFVGQTAIKTGEVVKSAFGGILFIDEAYSLSPADNSNDFGRESIETLLKMMEDHRDDLIVIVAGYQELMGRFIASNPGLQSRFNRYFQFEDYGGDELYSILLGLCKKHEYTLGEEADGYAKQLLDAMYLMRGENFGNARDVRNLFENVVAVHSDRVSAIETPTREDLTVVMLEDMEKAALI